MNEPKIADNAKDTPKHGRRSTDDPKFKENMPSPVHSNWRSVFNGLGLAFILTVAVASGKLLGRVDANSVDIEEAKNERKEIIVEIRELVYALKDQNIQQKESGKRFEEKFDDANEKLDKINEGVQKNRENIIILQNGKVSMRDKTSVKVAMR